MGTCCGNVLSKVGTYNSSFNKQLGINLPCTDIFQSDGLEIHIQKNHPDYVKHMNKISDIISHPDYIGVDPTKSSSIELVKCYDENFMVAIRLDTDENYLYVATFFDIKESKIKRRLNSGRLKTFY